MSTLNFENELALENIDSSAVDVIVVGSGVAGMTAAIVAQVQGLTVEVIEKSDYVGGATALSAGAAWVPGCRHVPGEDNPADPLRYLHGLMGERADSEILQACLDQGVECLEFLEANTSSVRFRLFEGADYRTDVEGASLNGRTVDPMPFNDESLGDLNRLIRPPMPWMTLFNGMQADNADVYHMQKALRSVRSLVYSIRLLLRHGYSLVRYGRSTRRVRGSALVAMLLKSALDLGIKVSTSSDCKQLLMKDGRAVGVVVERGGRTIDLHASAGVVLAAGGFSGDSDMRALHTKFSRHHRSLPPSTNVGDGIKMALNAGARLETRNFSSYCYTPVSVLRQEDGSEIRYPHFSLDRCKPGAIVVGHDGKRFVNEACSYHDFVLRMHESGAVPAFLIADKNFLRKYGMGMAHQFPFPYRSFVRNGYLVEALTLPALAKKLDIDADGLVDTVKTVNAYARTGEDPEFGKGRDQYSRSLGDPEHGPNPCLGTIGEGPYFAVKLFPGDTGTTCGLVTSVHAEVLDIADNPIPGLYACGMDMNNPTMGIHPSSGCNIGPSMAFGYVAAKTIARQMVERRHVSYKFL
jgi:succinate dehydrogenase/fumarate reductase flavoprotein subunit